MEVTKWLKPSISVSRIGDSASVQAATRVNVEQASKRTMCRPTRLPYRGRSKWLGEMSEDYAELIAPHGGEDRLRLAAVNPELVGQGRAGCQLPGILVSGQPPGRPGN